MFQSTVSTSWKSVHTTKERFDKIYGLMAAVPTVAVTYFWSVMEDWNVCGFPEQFTDIFNITKFVLFINNCFGKLDTQKKSTKVSIGFRMLLFNL